MKLLKYTIGKIPRMTWDLIINIIAASKLTPEFVRYSIYTNFGIKTKSYRILPGCFFTYFTGKKVSIGKGTFINYSCFFDNSASITIGDNCDIAFGVTFCTSTHEMGSSERRAGSAIGQPIIVGKGCWIGARSMILPGVSIGSGCIIAAGSVVTKECEPNSLYAGVPAKRIKILE